MVLSQNLLDILLQSLGKDWVFQEDNHVTHIRKCKAHPWEFLNLLRELIANTAVYAPN